MICHDLGRHIGPYGLAAEQSPRLNQFAEQSIRLDNYFVTSPGCSQSRSSLITGRYPHANGQFGLAHLGWDLKRDQTVLPQALQQTGYHTTLFGIWHLHEWTIQFFDTLSDDVCVRDISPEGYAEVASARAETWINNWAKSDQNKPFYLHLGFWETHRPFCGHEIDPAQWPQVDLDSVDLPDYLPDNESTRREFAELHRSVGMVDAAVKRVLGALDQAGLTDNTLVIFTADHGLPFPRAKGTLYDPGVAVAFLARWPGRIRGGTTTSELASNVDLMPTLLDIAGGDIPSEVQGQSFADLLTGAPEPARRRDANFAEKTYHEHYDPMRCIRTDQYKLIRNFADRPALVMPSDIYNCPTRRSMTEDEMFWSHRPEYELYDLTSDPRELHNLAESPDHQSILTSLRNQLHDWMKRTGDPLLDGPIARPAGSTTF